MPRLLDSHVHFKLFKLIEKTNAQGVILLSGNVHFAEISVWQEGSYPLYDFTSSGMTHINSNYAAVANPYRVEKPYVEHNFGLIEIDWENKINSTVTFKAISADGNLGLDHQILLNSLTFKN